MSSRAVMRRRGEAFFIDLFLSFFIYVCISNFFNSSLIYSSLNSYVKFIVLGNIYIISWWIYYSLSFLVIGESLGKSLRRIRVVKIDSDKPYGVKDILFRELFCRLFDYYLFGYIWFLFNSRRQCLHDFLVGTVVVKDDDQKKYTYKCLAPFFVSLLLISIVFFKNDFITLSGTKFPIEALAGSSFIQDAYSQSELKDQLVKMFKEVSFKDLSDQEYLKKRILNDYRDFVYFPDRYEISDENLKLFISASNGQINHASNSMLSNQKYLRWNLDYLSKKNDRKIDFLKFKNQIEAENKFKIKENLSSIEKLRWFIRRSPEELKYIPLEFFNDLIFSNIRKLNVDFLLLLSEEVQKSEIFKNFIIKNDLNYELHILTDKDSLEKIKKKKQLDIEKIKKKVLLLSSTSLSKLNLFNLRIDEKLYMDKDFTNFILRYIPAKVMVLPDFAKFDKALSRKALKESFKNKGVRSSTIRGPILNDPYNHLLCFSKDPSSISLHKFDEKLNYNFISKILNKNRAATRQILEININDKKLWSLVLNSWSYKNIDGGGVNYSLIGYIPDELLSNNDFVRSVLKVDPVSIFFLPGNVSLKLTNLELSTLKYKARAQFLYELKNLYNPELLIKRLSVFKDNRSIAEEIVSNRSLSRYFYLLSENVRFDRDISYKALNVNIQNYPWVSNELRSRRDNVLKYAVNSEKMYVPFLKNPIFKNRDFVIDYLALLSSSRVQKFNFHKTYIHKSLLDDPGISEYLKINFH